MLDVTILANAISVFSRENRCWGFTKYYKASRVNWYVCHTIYPVKVSNSSIPTPRSSQCERTKTFHIGVSVARHAMAGMTQKGSQWGMVLSSGN
jgi:hypothetical protein